MIATAAYIYGVAIGAWPLDGFQIGGCIVLDFIWADILSPDFS